MNCRFIVFESKAPDWLKESRQEYLKKIKPFAPFAFETIKSVSQGRDQASVKLKDESELLLKKVARDDYLVLFDVGGKLPKSSEEFASGLETVMQSGKRQITFVIGGAYGFSPEIKKRAQLSWSLSPLTLNHWVAQMVALEQIYRGFTIIKGIPYHNS